MVKVRRIMSSCQRCSINVAQSFCERRDGEQGTGLLCSHPLIRISMRVAECAEPEYHIPYIIISSHEPHEEDDILCLLCRQGSYATLVERKLMWQSTSVFRLIPKIIFFLLHMLREKMHERKKVGQWGKITKSDVLACMLPFRRGLEEKREAQRTERTPGA